MSTGALDNVLGVHNSLPATCEIYLMRPNRKCCILRGISSRLFVESKGTSGLWSVSKLKCIPIW